MAFIEVDRSRVAKWPGEPGGYEHDRYGLPLPGRYISLDECSQTASYTRIVGGPLAGKRVLTGRLYAARGPNTHATYSVCTDCGCIRGTPPGYCHRTPTEIDDAHLACPTCSHHFCRHCYMPSERPLCAVCEQRRHEYRSWTTQGRDQRLANIQRLGRSAFPTISLWERDGAALQESFPFVYEPNLLILRGDLEADITEEAQALLRRDLWCHITNGGRSSRVYITTDIEGTGLFEHYHVGCWGDVQLPVGATPAQIAEIAHDVLTVVNGASPARERPIGLPYTVAHIPHGPTRSTRGWNTERIRVLTERERLLQDIFSRQQGVDLAVPESIMVVGCGGVGWYVALQAALIGVKRILLVDYDHIDLTNMSRLPTSMVDMLKATDLAHMINGSTWRALVGTDTYNCAVYERQVQELSEHINTGFFRTSFGPHYPIENRPLDVILDTTDDIATQRSIYRMARRCGARYIRAGYDGGWHVTVSSRESPEWEVEGTTPGYRVAAWVGGAQFAASIAITKMCYKPELEISADIRHMLVQFHQEDLVVTEDISTWVEVPEEEGIPVLEVEEGIPTVEEIPVNRIPFPPPQMWTVYSDTASTV